MSPSNRIALSLEYDGSFFSGWQKQSNPELDTVQQGLETALSQIADEPVTVTCAGRTDAGVHATSQVVHFDCSNARDHEAWVRGSNSLLPAAIRVLDSAMVDSEFSARFSALSRRYIYVLHHGNIPSAFLHGKVTALRESVDVDAMSEAGQQLIGEHDFSSFRAAGCQSNSPFRNVSELSVRQQGEFILVEICANAFLQHMVRNIVGALLEAGRGERPPSWLGQLLAAQDRTLGAVTAPPVGLYLVQVEYPAACGFVPPLRLPPFLGA